jgi:tetratricopeptide (TPR) repeat protein
VDETNRGCSHGGISSKPTPEEAENARLRAEAWIGAEELCAKGEFTRAQEILEQAYDQFPNDTRILRSLAQVYADLGDHDKSLALYSIYFAHPYTAREDPSLYAAYGEELLAAGREGEAFEAFKEAVRLSVYPSERSTFPDPSPQSDDFTTIRAAAHLGSGFRYHHTHLVGYRGIPEMRKAVEIAPTYETARLHLALTLIQLRTEEGANESQPHFQELMKSTDPEIQSIAADYNGRIEYYRAQAPMREEMKHLNLKPRRLTNPADVNRKTP